MTDPHGKPARSASGSVVKLVVVAADHLVGWHRRWKQAARDGLLLVERGWADMLVDPRRYRLAPGTVRVAVALGRMVVPRPDLVLVLGGDATVLHARKPELGVEEIARQVRRWREVAAAVGPRVLEVDTVATPPAEVARRTLDALTDGPRSWRRVPFTAGRLDMSATGDVRSALGVYQPFSRRARIGARLVRASTRLPSVPASAPIEGLDGLWTELGIVPRAVVAMRSSTDGRSVLGVSLGDRLDLVVKIGRLDDARLRHEAAVLATELRPGLPFHRPETHWAGEWQEHFVLATRAVRRTSSRRWNVAEVLPIVESLADAGTGRRSLVHGDLAPWNLVRTSDGVTLIDWESSRWDDEPLHDLCHFVVQSGALLARHDAARAFDLITGPGSPGRRVLARGGRDEDDATALLVRYLTASRPTEARAQRFRDEMLRLVTS